MKRVFTSLLTVVAVALVAVGATTAFFTDVETSSDNSFQSGSLDLTIDNESFLNGVLNEGTTWLTLANLDDNAGPGPEGSYLFFNFSDLKPGDEGEDTISLHVTNDAWTCMDLAFTSDTDETCTDSEIVDDPDCPFDGGELAENLDFIFWVDDGDNVLEDDEVGSIFAADLASTVLNSTWTLADAGENNVGEANGDPMFASHTYYIGKAWCFGSLTLDATASGQGVDPTVDPGIDCDGSLVDNAPQTDKLKGTVSFYSEQWKNNPGFQCGT